jgi:hypothetical protein
MDLSPLYAPLGLGGLLAIGACVLLRAKARCRECGSYRTKKSVDRVSTGDGTVFVYEVRTCGVCGYAHRVAGETVPEKQLPGAAP